MAQFSISMALTFQREGGFFVNPSTREVVNRGITASTLAFKGLLPPDLAAEYQAFHSAPSADESLIPNLISYMQSRTVGDDSSFYLKYYWIPLRGDQILSQTIANKLFDVEVNQGGIAVQEMQQAINDLQLGGALLEVDGDLGPKTLVALNSLPESKLLPAFQARVEDRYREVAAKNPALVGNLGSRNPPSGWLGRLYS